VTEFPTPLAFKYTWRKYQQRVLNELDSHLNDNHLHVIAPPGSGKTVLGLEVAIRLNQPVLILAPTLAVRNQWIQRFCELFLQESHVPEWISRDIRNPAFMTVTTYQALYAACTKNKCNEKTTDSEKESTPEDEITRHTFDNLEAIVKGLKKVNIRTIIADEAHHLKNEWWQALIRVKQSLKPVIVGLTATPPYDVSALEWQRYLELNGSVDAEISVPELVAEGDLCPHQDCIFLTLPTESEQEGILRFRQTMHRLFETLKQDATLIEALTTHPAWKNPAENLEWIYTNLNYFSSILIFLNANGHPISPAYLDIIGDSELQIPVLDYSWMAVLLEFYLFREKVHFMPFEEHRQNLENKLSYHGALDRQQVNFSTNSKVTGFLTSSRSKLHGIKEIVDFEFTNMGNGLRMVILTDYIRKEYLCNPQADTSGYAKIGVIPIFEIINNKCNPGIKLGVLTGSLIILPKSTTKSLMTQAQNAGINSMKLTPFATDANYYTLQQDEQNKHHLVELITQLFQQGEIEVLIGTKSLLGEGWDAPAINSLILASFVGSFVLSNQMRGRAIRIQNGNSDKTSNIWHLACIDATSTNGGDDMELMKRRFRSFVGISHSKTPCIENGFGRMNLEEGIKNHETLTRINGTTFQLANDRISLKKRWKQAIDGGVTLVEEIKIPFKNERSFREVKKLYLNKTIANLMALLSLGFVGYLEWALQFIGRIAKNVKTMQDLYLALTVLLSIAVFTMGRFSLKTLKLYLTYRDIAKDIRNIGDALLASLVREGTIHTPQEQLKVIASVDEMGAVYCHLEGGTTFEKSTFINALHEVIGLIDNPRYVIIRKNKLLAFIQQKDYHPVPEILGRNKVLAVYFKDQWIRMVGNCELIYTRTLEGRKLLLKSRIKSLSAQFETSNEQVNKWR
jgi:superfamily II DNA or RNA helicase